MAVRITVQADNREECNAGFETVLKALAAVAVPARPTLGPCELSAFGNCIARVRITLPE